MKTKIKFLAMMLMGVMLSTNVWGETYTIMYDSFSPALQKGGYGDYKDAAKDATAAGLALSAQDISTNNNNTPTGYANSQFITIKKSTGFITNTAALTLQSITIVYITGGFTVSAGTAADELATVSGTAGKETVSLQGYSGGAVTDFSDVELDKQTFNVSGNSFFKISAGSSSAAQIRSITITTGVPCTTDLAAPVVTATAGNGSATLTWGAVEHASNYTVTCIGATIGAITGEGTKTCTLTDLTNGTEYTWKVKAIGSGIYCDSEEATDNVTPSANHTVTWYVDGFEYTTGSPTTEVVPGGKVTTLPTQPAVPTACAGSVFVGWTDHAVTNGNKPSPLFKDAASAPVVNANVNYHAVFADPELMR